MPLQREEFKNDAEGARTTEEAWANAGVMTWFLIVVLIICIATLVYLAFKG